MPLISLYDDFQKLPFLQLKLWEATQQIPLTFAHFISATGPIFLLSIASIYWFFKSRVPEKIWVGVFVILSYALFFSPFPSALGISHIRFLSTTGILCLSIISIELFKKNSVTAILLVILTIILLPNHFKSIRLASDFSSKNIYQYIPSEEYALFQKVRTRSTSTDVFLVLWPYNSLFPALTGRRSYNGHPLLTIDAQRKEMSANLFFSHSLDDEESIKLLRTGHITHIIAYTWETFPGNFYQKIDSGGSLAIYKVQDLILKSYSK